MEENHGNPYAGDAIRSKLVKNIDFSEGETRHLNTKLQTILAEYGIIYLGDLEKLEATRVANKLYLFQKNSNTDKMEKINGVGGLMVRAINHQLNNHGLKMYDVEDRQYSVRKNYAADDFKVKARFTNDNRLRVDVTVPNAVLDAINEGHIYLTDSDPKTDAKRDIDAEFLSMTQASAMASHGEGITLFFNEGVGLDNAMANGIGEEFAQAVNKVLPRAMKRKKSARYSLDGKL